MRKCDGVHGALFAAALLLGGCNAQVGADRTAGETTASTATSGGTTGAIPAPTPVPAPVDSAAIRAADSASHTRLPTADVRVEVDLTARQLRLYRGDAVVATHPVAVGSPEWPTRTGEWHIVQVVWNPEWIPPDESWAEERKPRKPGDPANPLGQAQLVYDPPRSIHGTNDSTSVGKAVSHGSIRAHNSVVKALARQLMEATGAGKDEAWYQETQRKRTVKQIVDLPKQVPIRVF